MAINLSSNKIMEQFATEAAYYSYCRCVCDPGFEVSLDKKNCLDINECRDGVRIKSIFTLGVKIGKYNK